MFGLALSSSVRREADRADHLEKELAEAREQATEAEQLAAQTRRSFEDFLLLAKAAVAGSVTVAVVAGVVAFMSIRSKKQVSTRLAAAVSRSAELEKTAQLLQTQNKDLKKFGHQKFATAMLGTADDLRRALDHISEDSLKNPEVEALHSGIEMVSTGFQRYVGGGAKWCLCVCVCEYAAVRHSVAQAYEYAFMVANSLGAADGSTSLTLCVSILLASFSTPIFMRLFKEWMTPVR